MPETEDNDRIKLIGEVEVVSGTTYNGIDTRVAVINNRLNPVRVVLYDLLPPPPLPTCPAWLDIDADDRCTISCESLDQSHSWHWAIINGNMVQWRLQSG